MEINVHFAGNGYYDFGAAKHSCNSFSVIGEFFRGGVT